MTSARDPAAHPGGGEPESPAAGRAQTLLFIAVLALSAWTLFLGLSNLLASPTGAGHLLVASRRLYWQLVDAVWLPFSTDPLLHFGIPGLLVLQTLLPGRPQDRVCAKEVLTDIVWMVIHAIAVGLFIWAFLAAADSLLEPLTRPIRLELLAGSSAWIQITLGYLLIDFLGWFNHRVRHRFPVLWVFHEVHHSQTRMNPFTLYRVHPVDYLIADAIALLPSLFFENTLGIVLTYLTISRFHDALTHSNIRSNLGWLRFVLVTPQSHRLHHSAEAEYFDKNFGVTLCLWDRVFGTHADSDFIYPRTGIPDAEFPTESTSSLAQLPTRIVGQLVYPFAKALRLCRGRSVPRLKP